MESYGFTTGAVNAGKQALRMVLVGKTGVGKSSSGNTILGRKAFQSNLSSATKSQEETGEFEGQTLSVVDTPGLLNTRLTEQQVKTEIRKCISLAAPGPHVFLFVIQAGRFTQEQQESVKIIQQIFGEEAAHYTMVLFTRGDDLEADGMTIEKIISDNPNLSEFIHKCHGRCHVFNNRKNDPSQIRELLEKVNTMVQHNGGRYYTDEMFRDAERVIREEMTQLQSGKTQNPTADVVPVVGAGAVEPGKQQIRMVLVGKTGVGKSSSGNTILGRKVFKLNPSATTYSQEETGEVNGQTLTVVDTPGLLNTRLTELQVKTEIRKYISLAAPGPHVFLIVLQGGRFMEEDGNIVKIIQKMFGEAAAYYTMVLFTCGDDLEADGDTIAEIIEKDKKLCHFIHQCHGRYHVFENRKQDPSQVKELLEKINKMVWDNRGRHYTSEMFREAEKAISEEMRRLQKENPEMAKDEARTKAQGWNIWSRVHQYFHAGSERSKKGYTQ